MASPGLLAGHLTLVLSLYMGCFSVILAASSQAQRTRTLLIFTLVNSSCEYWGWHSPLSSADKKVLLKCKILKNVFTS